MTALTVNSANVALPDGSTHRRVRFVAREGGYRVLDRRGRDLSAGVGVTAVEQTRAGRNAAWTVSLADGSSIAVEKAGCGCGGR